MENSIRQDSIYCQEVIINTTKVIGTGGTNDPMRKVVQVFTKDGQLIAEFDQWEAERRKQY